MTMGKGSGLYLRYMGSRSKKGVEREKKRKKKEKEGINLNEK